VFQLAQVTVLRRVVFRMAMQLESAIRWVFPKASVKLMESQSLSELEARLPLAQQLRSVMAFPKAGRVFRSVSNLERLAASVIRSAAASRRSAKAFLRA